MHRSGGPQPLMCQQACMAGAAARQFSAYATCLLSKMVLHVYAWCCRPSHSAAQIFVALSRLAWQFHATWHS